VSEIAFVVRLGLHGLTATLALLFSLSIEVVDGSPDQLAALAGLVVVAVAAGAAAETAWRVWRSERSVDGAAAAAIENAPDGPAHRDALTGLPSRDAFCARLRSILEGQRRSDRMVAVLALEFADLKTISATLGGAAADLVVRHASTRLLAILRDTDMLARLGAGELAVIQSDIEDPARAWALCERLAAVLDEPFDLCGRLSRIGARIGVAIGPSDGQDPETLLGHARLARSRGKSARPTFRFYQDVLDAKLRERRAFERDLANALAHEEFEIEYQPQIDIASRRMVASRHCCAGTTPHAGASNRTVSFRLPRTPA
jgi:diguanylate cyclase (GGDEF)-like protein